MFTTKTPSIANLKRAIEVAEQIERLQAQLAALVGGNASIASAPSAAAVPRGKKRGKRVMSPEARERIAAAQRARWAKSKGTSTPVAKAPSISPASTAKPAAPKAARKAKRNISPEARAKMAAAAKRRWAKVKK